MSEQIKAIKKTGPTHPLPGGRRGMMGGHRGMAPPLEKAKDFKAAWAKLCTYCRAYLPAIIIALLAAIAGTVMQIAGPDKLKDITDEIAKGLPTLIDGRPAPGSIDLREVLGIARFLIFLYGGSALLSLSQSWIMATVTQKISKTLRTDISQKINRLPLGYFDRSSYGDVLSRVTNDVDTIGMTMNQSMGSLITSITLFFGTMFMMFYNSVPLALTAVVTSLVGFLLMMFIMKNSQKYFISQQNNLEISTAISRRFSPGITWSRSITAANRPNRPLKRSTTISITVPGNRNFYPD